MYILKKFRTYLFLKYCTISSSSYLLLPLLKIFKIKKPGGRAVVIIQALERTRQALLRNRGELKNIAEFGVAEGEGLLQLSFLVNMFCDFYKIKRPNIIGFDTYEGLPEEKSSADRGTWQPGDYPSDIEILKNRIKELGLEKQITLKKGLFSDTVPKLAEKYIPDFILIDCDYYSSTCDSMLPLFGKLKTGTIIYFDDLGTNFYNKNIGEEKFIYETRKGTFGDQYYLHHFKNKLYIYSDSNNLYPDKNKGDTRRIKLSNDKMNFSKVFY